MKWKFWQRKPKENPIVKSATRAIASIDKSLPESASDADFMLAIGLIAGHWCVTDMEGQKLSRKEAIHRAGLFYHSVNERIYKSTEEESDITFLG